ncbi:MAG: dihydrolipoyl dehydrogenase [Gemmatimonadaceae bacterium]
MTATPLTPDVVVIGGGPGGYVASIRAAQLGLSVVCVEFERTLGGTCVNVGCIPSKALLGSSEHYEWAQKHAGAHGVKLEGIGLDLAQMMKRKDDVVAQNTRGVEFLFKKNKVTWAKGVGTLRPGNVVEVKAMDGTLTTYRPRHVIIATGSVPVTLPFFPFDEERVLSNVGALRIPEVPQHLVVIGGGVIGLELGSVWRRLGTQVTVVEFMPTILPGNDDDIIKEAAKVFARQGLELHTATKVVDGRRDGRRVIVETERLADGGRQTFEADYLLVSIGRQPALTGVDAAALGLALGRRGEIVVDDQMRTNLPNVFAIGDAVGGKLLAHKAEEEGVIAAEVIAGRAAHMHYHNMPAVVYTWPEIATAGITEAEAKAAGRAVKIGKFPFSANGRARTMANTDGFVKFVTDARTDEILGCHMIGPNVSDLLAAVVLAMEYRGTADDIGETVHSHPTLGEAVKEAALGALGRAIHL